jgi:hypothetical protein
VKVTWVFFALTAFFIAFISVLHADANEFSTQELSALTQRVSEFEKGFSTLDVGVMVSVIPPKIWAFMLDKGNATDAQMKEGMQNVLNETMSQVAIENFNMESEKVSSHMLPDGTRYLLVPTETIVSIPDNGKTALRSQTLALLEDGKWYLIRISDQQQRMILGEVYPQFKSVEFPDSQWEKLKD